MARAECAFDVFAESTDRTLFFRVVLKPSPRAEYISPSVTALLGRSQDDFYEDLTLLLSSTEPHDRSKVIQLLQDPETCPVPLTVDHRHRDGRRVRLEYDFRVIVEGERVAIEGIAQNVTGRTEKEEQLEQLTLELSEARVETLHRLALAAEYRDDETNQHTQRVAETCALICKTIGLPAEVTRRVRLAAPLHDVGKIGIPDRILLKPGPLTKDEFELMQNHTTIGAAILGGSHSSILNMGADIALSHHERWDGSGYPGRIAGEAIPLPARILSVADVLDALTHDRPYKEAWSLERALEEIQGGRGSQFDPEVVDALMEVVERHTAPLIDLRDRLSS